MAFFLFIALSSLALPPLNSFIGEFMILIGTFEHHHAWASWAASGAILSAIYLLWAYQRVGFGEVTVEKNKTLPDASGRERLILATMSLVIIFMGVASPLFTRRMEPAANTVLLQMDRVAMASRKARGLGAPDQVAVLPAASATPSQATLKVALVNASQRRVQP
jgi:NADH-quinone oxidoreductase subunit M